MKIKLTTLLFGLLLAVGWTSNAFAQSATFSAESIKTWTYTWVDAQGTTQTSNYVLPVEKDGKTIYAAPEVTNPYQIYGLLRAIYMDKRLPGPYQSAYTSTGAREDDVYYGGARNGWDIPGNVSSAITTAIGAKTVTVNNDYSGGWGTTYYPTLIGAIRLVSGTKIIASWTSSQGSSSFPFTTTGSFNTNGYLYRNAASFTITIPASMTQGYESVEIQIYAGPSNSSYTDGTISIGGTSKAISSESWYTWNFNAGLNTFATDTYKPNKEGYTAIAVALKNTPYIPQEPSRFGGSTAYLTKDSVINYIEKNIQFVKLLTDGLRITDAGGNPGTVFNADGTYNKFFFLGKGKARQKGAEVKTNISNGTYPYYAGECVIFWPLFEEFSPTTAHLVGGSTTVDFYDRMMEGNVYDVVHDCAGVIQNRHEFSLSGENGTDDYPFTGLNFFIPDYRLKFWVGRDSVQQSNGTYQYIENVDGRNMNGIYQLDGTQFKSVSPYYSNYAQYNPDYAPKVGIYRINLSATATQVETTHDPNNLNFVVTLTWVSSLDQMAGTTVPQTYTIYVIDNVTGERIKLTATGVTNPTGQTTVNYLVPQREHSYTIEYIIQGSPDDSDHPSFVAWSNRDQVIIPGWDDFIGLQLDHHESDFAPDEMANYYRNFLEVVNEDIYNGLTVSKIQNGMNEFILYRFERDSTNKPGTPIAKVTFGAPDVAAGTVPYTVTYLNTQVLLDNTKYALDESHLNVPLTGVVRVKGNGDIVIWPNNYTVNFKSIIIKDGTTELVNWNATQAVPSTWGTSPGSEFEPFTTSTTGEKVYYMMGGGYLYIPGILSQHPNATVEIEAFGDAGNVNRITVNDKMKNITATAGGTKYTWGGNDDPVSPSGAPRRDNNNNN